MFSGLRSRCTMPMEWRWACIYTMRPCNWCIQSQDIYHLSVVPRRTRGSQIWHAMRSTSSEDISLFFPNSCLGVHKHRCGRAPERDTSTKIRCQSQNGLPPFITSPRPPKHTHTHTHTHANPLCELFCHLRSPSFRSVTSK